MSSDLNKPQAYMYGMSPGDPKEHIPEAVPIDAAVYIAQAKAIRGITLGVLYQDDEPYRWCREAQHKERREQVEWRTRIIECIAGKVDPSLRLARDSKLVLDGHMQEVDEQTATEIRKKYQNKQEGNYNVYQRRTITGLRNLLGLQWNEICKFGWYADRRVNTETWDDECVGGEVDHDMAAPEELLRVYVNPGYELYRRSRYTNGTTKIYPARIGVPYLYAKPEGDPAKADDRIVLDGCLKSTDGLANQLARMRQGVTKVAYAQAEVFGLSVLQKPIDTALAELRTHAPNWREEEIHEAGEIERIRDLVEAAIVELRTCLA